MSENKTCPAICFTDYKEEGIYIILPDETQLLLTRTNVERIAKEFWNDPAKISVEIKKASKFQRCEICSKKGLGGLCNAVRPIFPLLEQLDKYVSYDKVIVVYSDGKESILHIADATIQNALRYISALSLMVYCQEGRKYWKYFYGINPLMTGKEIASRICLNMYWLYKSSKQEEIDKIIKEFTNEIRITSKNQVERLNLVCKNDAFMNAFVNTQLVTEFLSMGIRESLNQSFENFENVKQDIAKYD